MKTVLNVGGHSKGIALPHRYAGWRVVMLDVDPASGADIIMDARHLDRLPHAEFDAVYCSHALEHFSEADGELVARGFSHLLKPDGFAEVAVPNIAGLIAAAARGSMELTDTWYLWNDTLPIRVGDVLYGSQREIAGGNEYFAHKWGYSPKSLRALLNRCGFPSVALATRDEYEIIAFAFAKETSGDEIKRLVGPL